MTMHQIDEDDFIDDDDNSNSDMEDGAGTGGSKPLDLNVLLHSPNPLVRP